MFGMEIAKIVLEYLKVLIWPAVIIYFLIWYYEALSDFFRRMVRGQVYGVSLEASSPSEQRKEIKEERNLQSQEAIEKYIRENPKEAIKGYLRVYNNYWFERAFNLIYGTQIALLEHLATRGQDGDTSTTLQLLFYQRFLDINRSAGLLPPKTTWNDYIGFLQNWKFVELADACVKISQFGREFLSYIRSQYPYYKYKAF